MSAADRTIAEPVTTLISVRVQTAERLRAFQAALGAPNYDAAICELLTAPAPTLRELRARAGLSQRAIATRLGSYQALISRLENGQPVENAEELAARVREAIRELSVTSRVRARAL